MVTKRGKAAVCSLRGRDDADKQEILPNRKADFR
jgi:hypothetical protein